MKRVALSVAAAGVGLAFLAASGFGAPGQAPGPAGVFRYSLDTDIDYVDPALAYYAPTWEILYATCSMLVNYPDAPAPRGARLVPEVATAFPRVSNDGRVYTFTLRKTYRFSNGRPITAESFAAAIHRTLSKRMASPARRFAEDIVGAEAVSRGDAKRARGVKVLGRHRLRITLERRAPDLLPRLAMPFFCAIPPNLPIDPEGISAPVVGSGPYHIAEWQRNRRIVLRRNRFYRGSRPQGPLAIDYDIGRPSATTKLRIDRGETDHGPVPPSAHAELGQVHGVRRSSPGRYFVNPGSTIRYFALNHERPLFGKFRGGAELGNVPLKQAVNFAIDRTAMLGQRGAYAGSFTDQYMPSTIPGGRNPAIYPTRPDLERARALARGNTREGEAVLYTPNRSPAPQIAQIAEANLAQIGIDVEIRQQPRAGFISPGTRGEPFDMALEAWRADYFDPWNYLFLLDGRTIRPANNTNLSYFDSREYNRKLARAASLTGQARYKAFGALDIDLAKNAAPLAAFAVDNERRYFSARVRGYFSHPVYGLDLAALRVR